MKYLIVGLGNPGPKYEETRHNAGFWFVDLLAGCYGGNFRSETRFHGQLANIRLGASECCLFKPSTFMNRSGSAIRAAAAGLSAASLFRISGSRTASPAAASPSRTGSPARPA